MRNRVIVLACACLLLGGSASAVVYVSTAGNNSNTGASWAQAKRTLQAGIDTAYLAGGDQVWVAVGTYNETRTEAWGTPSVTGSLVLKDNVQMYGGFVGTETLLSQRDPYLAPTIIDGSSARGGTAAAYHVVVVGRGAAASANVRLDGFSITGGNASGTGGTDYHGYRGAGLYNWQSAPVIANCTFYGNTATVSGGAIANEGNGANRAVATYLNCLVYGNTATRGADGLSNPIRSGGGAFVNVSDPSFIHCTIDANVLGNTGTYTAFGLNGGGIYAWSSNVIVNGSIIWGNTNNSHQNEGGGGFTFTYCDTQSAVGGTGNIVANPVFSGANRFLTIGSSPCINTVNAAYTTSDLAGVPRPIGSNADMGCWEASPTAPVAACAPYTVSLDSAGNGSMTVANINGGSSAEAGIYSLVASQTAFTCSNLGNNSVTLTVTDRIGRTNACTATVTVQDLIPPTANCVAAGAVTVNLSSPTLTAATLNSGSSDNCTLAASGTWLVNGAASVTYTCANVGSNAVTLTVYDTSGNPATCNTSVNVVDNVPPTVVTKPYTVNLDSNGNGTMLATDIDGGSTDACGIQSRVASKTSFNCSNLGANTVTLTVTDVNGNSASNTATVTVADNLAPTATAQSLTVPLTGSGATVAATAINNGSTDNCSIASYAIDRGSGFGINAAFSCSDLGANPVTLRVTDGSGNSATAAATITIVDNTNPTVVTTPYTVVLDGAGNGTLTASNIDGGSTDNCTITSRVASKTSFDCSNLGANNVTLTVADQSGNSAGANAVVTVVDNTNPTASCKNFTLDLATSSTVTFADLDNGSSDNCSLNASATTIVPDTFDCDDLGTNNVTMTIYDTSGNSASCNAVVTVIGDLSAVLQTQAEYDLYDGDALPGNIAIRAQCGTPPYVSFDWYYDADGFGAGAAEQAISNGLGGHPADSSITVTISTASPNSTIDFDTLSTAAAGYYRCVVTDSDAPANVANSGAVFVDVRDPVSVDVDPVGGHRNTTAPNNSITMSVSASGGHDESAYTYEWYKVGSATPLADGAQGSGSTISGAATASMTIGDIQLADAGSYYCVVIDWLDTSASSRDQSANAALTVTDLLTVSDPIPSPQAVYVGTNNITLTATASDGDGTYSSFAWYFDADGFGTGAAEQLISAGLGGHPVDSGATVTITTTSPSSTLELDGVGLGSFGYYACWVDDTSPDPEAVPAVPGYITVYNNLTITTDLELNTTANEGDLGWNFTIETDGGLPPLGYDWYFDNGGGPALLSEGLQPSGTTITGTNTASIAFDTVNLGDAGDYYVVITDNGTQQVISTTSTFFVTNFMNTTVPLNVRAYAGYTPLQITATVINGIPPYTYTWYKNGSVVAGPQQGLNVLDLGTVELGDAGTYSVLVSDSSGGANPDDTSDDCVVETANAPSISVQPQDVYGYVGQNAGFSVTVVDGFPPYTYDWQLGGASLGAPSQDSYALPVPLSLGDDGDSYDVVVRDQGVNQVDPNTVVVTDITSDPAIVNVSEPLAFTPVHPGNVAVYTTDPQFNLATEFTGGLEPMTSTWSQTDTATSTTITVAGPTAVTVDPDPLVQNTLTLWVDPATVNPGTYLYNAAIEDQVGETLSDSATVLVAQPLTIVQDLVDADAIVDKDYTWAIEVEGGMGTVTYSWEKDDGTGLFFGVSDARFSGTDTNTLVVDPVIYEDAGTYRVEICDDNDCIYTAEAEMGVRAGVPVTGLTGLALLSLVSALGGASALRRRK